MAEESEPDFQAMLEESFPDKIVTNYIIIAESVSANTRDLHVQTSDQMTTWLATGMLNCASEVILNQGYAEQDGDEE